MEVARTACQGGLNEIPAVPPERAARPDAASSVAPVPSRHERSLRPCLGTTIALRRRAESRQALLALAERGDVYLPHLRPRPVAELGGKLRLGLASANRRGDCQQVAL